CAHSDRDSKVAAPDSSGRSGNNPRHTPARPRPPTTARGWMIASPSYRARRRVCVPTPVTHQRHIFAVAGDVLAMFDQPVLHFVLEVITAAGELRQTIDHVLDKVEAIHIFQHPHIA